jgi:hypothetical protein
MSDPRIRAALEAHLEDLAPPLATAWENRDFDPPDGAPYQEAFMLPGPNKTVGLSQRTAINIGVFQVNLCYPSRAGAEAVEARGKALQDHFNPETTVLESDGIKVRIQGRPVVGASVPGRPGRYVVPVSIRYESTF